MSIAFKTFVVSLFVAGALAFMADSTALAGTAVNTQVEVVGNASLDSQPYDYVVRGGGQAQTGGSQDGSYADPSNNWSWSMSGSAATNLDAQHLMSLQASASFTARSVGQITYPSGWSGASAGWQDSIKYSGTMKPSYLNLTVKVEGSWATADDASATVSLWTPDHLWTGGYNGTYPAAATEVLETLAGREYILPYGRWDSFQMNGSDFVGFFTFATGSPDSNSNYDWRLTASIQAAAIGYISGHGAASIDMGNTVSLVSVSLPDKTPVSPSDLSFGSGLKLGGPSAVPEPATWVGMMLGGLTLAGWARWGRSQRRSI